MSSTKKFESRLRRVLKSQNEVAEKIIPITIKSSLSRMSAGALDCLLCSSTLSSDERVRDVINALPFHLQDVVYFMFQDSVQASHKARDMLINRICFDAKIEPASTDELHFIETIFEVFFMSKRDDRFKLTQKTVKENADFFCQDSFKKISYRLKRSYSECLSLIAFNLTQKVH